MPDTVPARPGQVWRSRDRREDRHVRVESVDPDRAGVVECRRDGADLPKARRTRILLDRHGRVAGYRLVTNTPQEQP